MDAFIKDSAFALRQLSKKWGIALIVVLSIAIGVATNTAVFGWINSIILDPLPVAPNSEQLVTFSTTTQSGEYIASSYADIRDYQSASDKLTGLAAFQERPFSLQTGQQTQRVWAMLVTGNFFDVLQLQPAAGRFFAPEHQTDVTGGQAVTVISDAFWRDQFERSPSAIGSTVVLNQQVYTIIGVAPPGFKGTVIGLAFDFWVPLLQQGVLTGSDATWIEDRKHRALHAIARLEPGVDLQEAQAELSVIGQRLAADYPDQNRAISATVFPLSRAPYGAQGLLSDLLNVLLIASFTVLLIVCANLGNLLLVRASEREKEFGIRLALGAPKGRIIRQVMTEGLLLAVFATVISLALIYFLSGLLRYFVPTVNLPVALGGGLTASLVVYALVLAFVTAILISLLPAMRAAGVNLSSALKDGTRGTSAGRGKRQLHGMLVVAQVALAFVALVGAGLFVDSFKRITAIDPGFDNDGVSLAALAPVGPGSGAGMNAFVDRAVEQLASLPAVQGVAYAEFVPLGLRGGSWEDLEVEGYSPAAEENMKIHRNFISPDYFAVMDIERVQGRDFASSDDAQAEPVAIINETFARRYFTDREAVGSRLAGWGRIMHIVGVVSDSKYASPTENPTPYLYVPFRQFAGADAEVILHIATAGGATDMADSVRRQINQSGSSAYVAWTMPLAEYTGAAVFRQKLVAVLLAVLGLAALVLAALGIYGVMSYSVTQRVNEIGIRMALGAHRGAIFRLIMLQGLQPVLLGLALGAVAAFATSRVLGQYLFALDAGAWPIFLGVGGILLVVALAAGALPTLRAGRLDPVQALSLR